METKDLILISFEVGNKIDNLWNMFIGIHVAILSVLHISKNSLSKTDCLAAFFLYTVFFSINYGSLNIAYESLEIIRADISSRDEIETKIISQARRISFSDGSLKVALSHVLGAIVVVYALNKSRKEDLY